MKISEIIKELPNHKRIIVMHDLLWINQRYSGGLGSTPEVIANCSKGLLEYNMPNYDEAKVNHFYENEAFDALVIKVSKYEPVEERNRGIILPKEKPRQQKFYTGSGLSPSGRYNMPAVYYMEED